MHTYLKSIGFGSLKTEQELEDVLNLVFRKYTDRQAVREDNGTAFVEYSRAFGPDFGITLCGEMDKNGFHQEYYFPYFRGTGVTSREDLMVEKHGSQESFAGVMEDARVGVSLIFYVQNAVAYKKACVDQMLLQSDREAVSKRNKLIAAARKGDEEAIESLTLEDMDTYTMISQRIQEEDLFTVIDTFMMPYGTECDLYQIMGEIKNVESAVNEYTDEKLYFMTLSCNDMIFDICINQKDLLGEPEEGRRFKGSIWMQGHINFEKELD